MTNGLVKDWAIASKFEFSSIQQVTFLQMDSRPETLREVKNNLMSKLSRSKTANVMSNDKIHDEFQLRASRVFLQKEKE